MDCAWSRLTDAEKGQLVSLWIVASSKDGVLPDDPQALQKMCGLDEPPNIPKLIELRFLVHQKSSKRLARTSNPSIADRDIDRDIDKENPSCSDSKNPESKPVKYSVWDYNFAERMQKDILDIAPNHNFNGASLKTWANEIRLLQERDRVEPFDIIKIWKWANSDPFWKTNILSPAKLRKQFTQLQLKMNETPKLKQGDGKVPPPKNTEWKKQLEPQPIGKTVTQSQVKTLLKDLTKGVPSEST